MKTVQSGKLILGDVTFKLEDGEYQNETVSPSISIQQHETGKSSIEISDKRVHIQLEGVAVVERLIVKLTFGLSGLPMTVWKPYRKEYDRLMSHSM